MFDMPIEKREPGSRDKLVRNLIIITALIFSPGYLTAQDPGQLTQEEMHKLHQNSKAYIALLEDPQRDAYQKPHEVIMALNLREGEIVADIGAGSGYFALRLAHHVGDKGRVYAVDINPDMIIYMNHHIRDMQLKNIETILAVPDDPLLMDASIDRFFICDTWHHIENKTKYLALMKKMLRPGGQVIMIEFHKRELPVGPPVGMKIAREDLLRQMETNGFKLVKEHTFLPYQYFLVFTLN
jgi:arsenite methyltransferase